MPGVPLIRNPTIIAALELARGERPTTRLPGSAFCTAKDPDHAGTDQAFKERRKYLTWVLIKIKNSLIM
jgi:hypothetical protein